MANVQLTLEINKEKENVPFTLKIKVASDFVWEEFPTCNIPFVNFFE